MLVYQVSLDFLARRAPWEMKESKAEKDFMVLMDCLGFLAYQEVKVEWVKTDPQALKDFQDLMDYLAQRV